MNWWLVMDHTLFHYDIFDSTTKPEEDACAKLPLQEYLNSRTDDNPALFVTLREELRVETMKIHPLADLAKKH